MFPSCLYRLGRAAIAGTAAGLGERPGAWRFLRDVRGGATSIVATLVAVMTVAAAALIVDHNWLLDQRDVMKGASDAAAVAATIEMTRPGVRGKGDGELKAHLEQVAETYVLLNLSHLSAERREQAERTLKVEVTPHRMTNTVDVTASADLGGTLFSRHLPVVGNYEGPASFGTAARVEVVSNPVEVVLAIDVSGSMRKRLAGTGDGADDTRSRMAIVRQAANDLVEILSPDEGNRVAVGVVPWATHVRLDPARREDWARNDWAEYPASRHFGAVYRCRPTNSCSSRAEDQELPKDPGEAWRGCLDEHRVDSAKHADFPEELGLLDLPSSNPFAQAFFSAHHAYAYQCLQEPIPGNYWTQSCYGTDTVGPPKTNDDIPAQWLCLVRMPSILPLTSDASQVRTAIDRLRPVSGYTQSALGILWGQRLLSPTWRQVWGDAVHPVDPGSKGGAGTRKAIVLLTDGEDTSCGSDPSCKATSVGLRREDACRLAKEQGTEIFVVAAMTPDKVSTALGRSLRECSSQKRLDGTDNPDGDYVFLSNSDAETLKAAFANIAQQLKVYRRVH